MSSTHPEHTRQNPHGEVHNLVLHGPWLGRLETELSRRHYGRRPLLLACTDLGARGRLCCLSTGLKLRRLVLRE